MTDATSDDLGALYWDSKANLSLNAVSPDDALWVDTSAARGEFSFRPLLARLGVKPETGKLVAPDERQYVLLAGHIGCGKSTELRRFIKRVDAPEAFHVVFVDAAVDLDPNNLQYVDVLMALGTRLCEYLENERISVDPGLLRNLEKWFRKHEISWAETFSGTAEVSAGIEVAPSVPLLGKWFAKLTTSFKSGASIKDEVRLQVRNSYSDFAKGFDQLVLGAEEALKAAGKARKILFVVDGTDKLRSEDTYRFFIEDVYQLQQVVGNYIYTARIDLLRETTQLGQLFGSVESVPMIKLHDRDNPAPLPAAYETLRELVYRRVDRRLFDSEDTVDYLIEMSGGHPRDLIRLLLFTFQQSDNERYTRHAAEAAVKKMATEYKRTLRAEDYDILVRIDSTGDTTPTPEIQTLLKNLAILEYNSYWWRSHPTVQTLEGYIVAWARLHAR